MKITLILGTNRKGTTYHLARMIADRLEGEVTEVFLPGDFSPYCTGCGLCFRRSETLCPHARQLMPITQAIDEADVLILASPVYVYHSTGAMKNLLDHYSWRWMLHRPEEKMFHKQAVSVVTAAGGGMKPALKDMTDSLFFWGVGRIHTIGIAAFAASYEEMTPKRQQKAEKQVDRIVSDIRAHEGRVKPALKTRIFFKFYRKIILPHMKEGDQNYWKQKGWDKNQPW
ncbi:MAG TPA: flavin reductase [Lachnospiraceae bacterium]|nr:flavin reductase [Lachnospiraceae bacterium]